MSLSNLFAINVTDRHGKYKKMISRPNVSPGFWLCVLIPLSYLISYYRHSKRTIGFEYKMTTISSIGLCMESCYIFLNIYQTLPKHLRRYLRCLPSFCTGFLIWLCLKQTIVVSLFWGISTIIIYSSIYSKLFEALPKSFTYGEASIVSQAFVLFILNTLLQVPNFLREPPVTDMSEMNAIMMTSLLCVIMVLSLIYSFKALRIASVFYTLMIALVAIVCLMPITSNVPVVTIWMFVTSDFRRVYIIIFYFGLVVFTIGTIKYRLITSEKASTIARKVFHLLIVIVYIPGILFECTLLYICTGVALASLLVFEAFRLVKLPPFDELLDRSFYLFSDEKDAGLVAVTPFYLLVGCSLPLWISPFTCMLLDSSDQNCLPLMAGILSIGVGDTAASVVGSIFGKNKWKGTSKSLEGTAANITLQSLTIAGLIHFGFFTLTLYSTVVVGTAIAISSIVEALTDQVDNLVVPLVFYIVCALS